MAVTSDERTPDAASLAPLLPRFPGVERIAVLRGGGIGDVLFAVPAAWSLRAAYPHASVTLLGGPAHRALFGRVTGPFDDVEVLPAVPGVSAPPDAAGDPDATGRFLERMRGRRFDLAVQLHGGGRYSNPFVDRLGARHAVGARTPDAPGLERALDYLYYQHEVLRALEVVGLAGAAPAMLGPRLEPHEDDVRAARDRFGGEGPLVAVHPGASDPRRRWPPEGFARVCRELVSRGCRVVLVGGGDDVAIADEILARCGGAAAGRRVESLAGGLSLPALAGLLRVADLMVADDSGPRHLAEAVGCPTAAVYWIGNLVNAGPLVRGSHRVQLSWTTGCPVCGSDCTAPGARCGHDVSFVADVRPEAVLEDALALLRRGRDGARQGQDSSSSWQTTSSRTSQPSG